MSASIGVAIPEAAIRLDASSLLKEADVALYAAKTAGRNTARVFTPELRASAESRLTTARASADGQFDLFDRSDDRPADLLAA